MKDGMKQLLESNDLLKEARVRTAYRALCQPGRTVSGFAMLDNIAAGLDHQDCRDPEFGFHHPTESLVTLPSCGKSQWNDL